MQLSIFFKEYLEESFFPLPEGKTSREIMEGNPGNRPSRREITGKSGTGCCRQIIINTLESSLDPEDQGKGKERLDQIVLDIEKSLQAGERILMMRFANWPYLLLDLFFYTCFPGKGKKAALGFSPNIPV